MCSLSPRFSGRERWHHDRIVSFSSKATTHRLQLLHYTATATTTKISTMGTMDGDNESSNPVLVFGVSGEQGRSVIESFVDAGYSPIYGFTSNRDALNDQYLSDALQCILLDGSLGNPADVQKALVSTRAQTIFLTTTMAMPAEAHSGFQVSQDDEYDCIVQFFATLKQVHEEDKLKRTVVFSTRDNVQELCRQHLESTGGDWIVPLDDGSIVPHYSGKYKNVVWGLILGMLDTHTCLELW